MSYRRKSGDVLAVTGRDWIDKGIEWISHSKYSHVAIFISEDKLFEAQGGRTLGECDLSYYLDSDSVARLEVWSDPTLTDSEREEIVKFAKSMNGIPYDHTVIPLEIAHFELGVKLDWYKSGKLDCSEFVNACGEHVGKHWANVSHPAPCEDIEGGKLELMEVLKGE